MRIVVYELLREIMFNGYQNKRFKCALAVNGSFQPYVARYHVLLSVIITLISFYLSGLAKKKRG